MSLSSLKSLSLSCFRGASVPFRLDFARGKKLTVIYGENGSGKSTLCDGLELLSMGQMGSLKDKGLGSNVEKYLPTIGIKERKTSVTLKTVLETYSATIHGRNITIIPAKNHLRVGVLRRSQILKVIDGQPAKRYEAIERFVDISSIEESETHLKKYIQNLKKSLDDSTETLNENLKILRLIYEQVGVQEGVSEVKWARERLSRPRDSNDVFISLIEKMRSEIQILVSFHDKYIKSCEDLNLAKNALDKATQEIERAKAQAESGSTELLRLFQAGFQYMHDHPAIDKCPLCDRSGHRHELVGRIDVKLKALNVLSDVVVSSITLRDKSWELQRAYNSLLLDYKETRNAFIALQNGHDWPVVVKVPAEPPPEAIDKLGLWINDNNGLFSAWEIIGAQWKNEKDNIDRLRVHYTQFVANFRSKNHLELLIPLGEKALASFISERQAFIDGIIKEIADDVGDLYEKIHPGEGLKKINMQLKSGKGASLEITSEFYQQTVPSQAYLSQSHLDTLGFCVFLALELRSDPNETILVIDDVFGSIDEPHVDRLIETIYGVSRYFRHCIVTTHYRSWREKFRHGSIADGECQFIELGKWTLPTGLHVIKVI